MKRFREMISIAVAKSPARLVLMTIVLLNVVFLLLAALVISMISPVRNEVGFWQSLYYTVGMMLDAGFVEGVVTDLSTTDIVTVLLCFAVVLVGMVTFTGAVIGYLTNFISNFIERASSGEHSLSISEHTVILNWNNRASEIVNELLYSDIPEKVVILTPERCDEIKSEIDERIADTLHKEHAELIARETEKAGRRLSNREKRRLIRQKGLRNRLTWIVRQGDVFSTKQLLDVSLDQAKTIVILGKDDQFTVCRYDREAKQERMGNSLTLKTLVQVVELVDAETSRDNQRVVVEVDDVWTMELVNMVIAQKRKHAAKCHIVPVPVSRILGQMLAQFSIMPELNSVYRTLFSYKDGAFYCVRKSPEDGEEAYVRRFLATHKKAVPLTFMRDSEGVEKLFYIADRESDLKSKTSDKPAKGLCVRLRKDFWMPKQNVIVLGHNSKSRFVMEGFDAFRNEWNVEGDEIMNVLVVDDTASLEQVGRYAEYPYVTCVDADIVNDKERICKAISDYVDAHAEDTSVLILSNDRVPAEELDANALTYLIYVSDIVEKKVAQDPTFDREKIDIVVELLNPKNYDVVNHYSVNNAVISNRYVSKMVTQIGKDFSLYDFYSDILTYDSANSESYESKEIYAKIVEEFLEEIPPETTADALVRALYEASPEGNRSILLGCVQKGTGKLTLFAGDLTKIPVKLGPKDKLIIFSNH